MWGSSSGAAEELLLALAEARLEASHATTGVEDLLLTGVEGVALAADVGRILPSLLVLFVVNVFPQVQVTVVSTYVGWISAFMCCGAPQVGGRRVAQELREPVPEISSVPEGAPVGRRSPQPSVAVAAAPTGRG